MMKILLVDDEEELVTTMAERLSYREIDADWAVSGEEAIGLAKKNTYKVAVLDVKMPRMGGFQLKKELESIQPDLKYIFLTGHGSEEYFKEGVAETGEDYYLIKPINIDSLLDKINEITTE